MKGQSLKETEYLQLIVNFEKLHETSTQELKY